MKTFKSAWSSIFVLSSCISLETFALSFEEAQEQAWALHNRLTGVPPSTEALNEMTVLMIQGHADEAAFVAMSSSYFYTSFLLRTFSPDSNRAKTSDLPLTDFTATIAGIVRDNRRFDELLYGDIIYTARDENIDHDPLATGLNRLIRRQTNQGAVTDPTKVRGLLNRDSATVGRYEDNTHYTDLQTKFPSSWENVLTPRVQSAVYQLTRTNNDVGGAIPPNDILGVMTTRQAASEFFNAGTNRRVTAAIYSNFLCADLESLHDTNISQAKIRRDIDRNPGGDPLAFVTKCAGCHSGLDAQTGALSYIDFRADQSRIVYDAGWVAACENVSAGEIANNPRCKQYRQYDIYPQGHRHIDNSFENYWTQSQNASLGWRMPAGLSSITAGVGANALGKIIAATEAFTNCMAHRVFKSLCGRSPTPNEWNDLKGKARRVETGIATYAQYGAHTAYNLKALIAQTAEACFAR